MQTAKSKRQSRPTGRAKSAADVKETSWTRGEVSLYDHVFDHSAIFNVVLERYVGQGLTPLLCRGRWSCNCLRTSRLAQPNAARRPPPTVINILLPYRNQTLLSFSTGQHSPPAYRFDRWKGKGARLASPSPYRWIEMHGAGGLNVGGACVWTVDTR
ncbi:hypothetical protein C8F04DRAFT_1387745 [Mycena alexandri]|uniref:Uncharacterized protein n=1 Tax=Mycena alexandri TaxID=1745969 RepID=A0AAD6XBA7_9AGAR|nr:hypothetical protein C8F04DRAFT_1387745 [Mycena alexandri]